MKRGCGCSSGVPSLLVERISAPPKSQRPAAAPKPPTTHRRKQPESASAFCVEGQICWEKLSVFIPGQLCLSPGWKQVCVHAPKNQWNKAQWFSVLVANLLYEAVQFPRSRPEAPKHASVYTTCAPEIPWTCPLRFSAPLKFPGPVLSDFRLLSNSWDLSSQIFLRFWCHPNLRGSLSNLRGPSPNLRGVLWNPLRFESKLESI